MAIPATYADLQTAVAAYAHRAGDTSFTAYVTDFISMCEARLNDMLLLKNMESDEALTLTTNNNYVALPTGYISPIAFWLVVDTQRVPLEFVLPQQLPYYTDATQPEYVAVDGANLRFDCPAGSNYPAFLRCIKASNLSGSVTSNELLLRRPDIYIAGALSAAGRFTKDQNLYNTWEPLFDAGCKELKAANNRNRGIANLRTDIPVIRQRSNILRGE